MDAPTLFSHMPPTPGRKGGQDGGSANRAGSFP
jgi:hypothetical protein